MPFLHSRRSHELQNIDHSMRAQAARHAAKWTNSYVDIFTRRTQLNETNINNPNFIYYLQKEAINIIPFGAFCPDGEYSIQAEGKAACDARSACLVCLILCKYSNNSCKRVSSQFIIMYKMLKQRLHTRTTRTPLQSSRSGTIFARIQIHSNNQWVRTQNSTPFRGIENPPENEYFVWLVVSQFKIKKSAFRIQFNKLLW